MTIRRRVAPQKHNLPVPPAAYDQSFMQTLVAIIRRMSREQEATLRGGWLNLSDLEPSVNRLVEGDVWQDNSVLRITRAGDYGSYGEALTAAVGNVTVTVV